MDPKPNAIGPHFSICQTGMHVPDTAPAIQASTIFIVDDDDDIRDTLRELLPEHGFAVECYASGQAFLNNYRAGRRACLAVDAIMPHISGIGLIGELRRQGIDLPVIMMSGQSTLHMAVQAMKAGALDFVEKPFTFDKLLAAIATALTHHLAVELQSEFRSVAAQRVSNLTVRQRQVMTLVVEGHPSKNIAADLQISQRTVDNHRAAIARKTGSKSLPALVQTALCAQCPLVSQVEPSPTKITLSNDIAAGKMTH